MVEVVIIDDHNKDSVPTVMKGEWPFVIVEEGNGKAQCVLIGTTSKEEVMMSLGQGIVEMIRDMAEGDSDMEMILHSVFASSMMKNLEERIDREDSI